MTEELPDGTPQPTLADDIIPGADAIARYLGMTARQVYAHVERGNLPFFKIGSTICVRKSTMLSWIGQQEVMASKPESTPRPASDQPPERPASASLGRPSSRGRR